MGRVLGVCAALAGGLALAACSASPERAAPGGAIPPAPAAAARALPEHGIEIVALRLSAGGRMLDLRYRVTDAARAAPLLARTTPVEAVDEATGRRLSVPRGAKVGAMRQTAVQPARGAIYFTFFGNAQGVVRRGSAVTVRFGDLAIRGLVVE